MNLREPRRQPRRAGKLVLLISVLVILFIGAVVYSRQQSDKTSSVGGPGTQPTAAESGSAKDACASDERIRRLEEEIAVLRRFSSEHPGKARPELLEVYGPDPTYDPARMEVAFYVAVPAELPLLQRMRLLASKVSRYRFDSLPIEVLRIDRVEGKSIAIINIEESDGRNTPRSWSGRYFQGSTGGQITQETLVRTFLQRGYPGEWVDGVRFYYEGVPFLDEWDHIRLIGTFFRDGTRDLG